MKPTILAETFFYPITSLPLSITSLDSRLYHEDKAGFRNNIMKISNSVFCCFPPNAKWIYDSMTTMRGPRPQKAYLDKCMELL